MSKPTENKPAEPFIHPITVRWGDCDPAEIAFTARIPEFALQSIDSWWATHGGFDWYRLNLDRNIGTPFVHMSLDFSSPITPRHVLKCQVQVVKLGEKSITFSVTGRQDGSVCFKGKFVCVFIHAKEFVPRRPPEDLEKAIRASMAANDGAGG
jgi:acyl-CoA thioesterase FadM